jgi:hypothetical protein
VIFLSIAPDGNEKPALELNIHVESILISGNYANTAQAVVFCGPTPSISLDLLEQRVVNSRVVEGQIAV